MARLLALLMLALGAALLAAPPARAQERMPPGPATDEPVPHSGTHLLMQRPEAREALREYRARRAAGQVGSARATAAPPEPGDTRSFRVYDFRDGNYTRVEFTLKVVEERFYIWVETDELGAEKVRDRDLDSLRRYLGEATPPASLFPDRGIIANDEEIFGDPPDVDGDGRTDVLVHDIRDGYDPPERTGYTAGYVDPADLTSRGNDRDILYLDSRPGIYRGAADSLRYASPLGLAATAAHEYQHLIHNAYDTDEITFVNEGLSEWAEVMNGFPLRTPAFLDRPDGANVPLLRWSRGASADDQERRLRDYQRAGLFTTYLAGLLGPEATGALTRDRAEGTDAYRSALAARGLALDAVVTDYHAANALGDAARAPRFGYAPPLPYFTARPSLTVDGRTARTLAEQTVDIEPGGAHYVRLTDVEDPVLTVSGSGLHARLLLRDAQGAVTMRDLALPADERLSGRYRAVTLVLTHPDPDGLPVRAAYRAAWTAERIYAVADLRYDDGSVARDADGDALWTRYGDPVEHLTRFDHPDPERGRLAAVSAPLYFFSQFSNSDAPPPDAPRRFTLTLREVRPDGSPGPRFFERTFDDPRPYQAVTDYRLMFAHVDLDGGGDLPPLPDAFFIGFHGATGGANPTITVPARSPEARSFLGAAGGEAFTPLWDLTLSDGTSLRETVVPIRAEFLLPATAPAVRLAGALRAEDAADHVRLHWTTLYEHLLDGLEVERAVDDGPFERLAAVESRGGRAGSRAYTFEDRVLPEAADTLRYRLRYLFADSSSHSAPVSLPAPRLAVVLRTLTAGDLPSGRGYRLSWQTGTERGLHAFVVERSLGRDRAADYDSLAAVPAGGGAYSYDDTSWPYDRALFAADTVRYRLRYELADGRATHSAPVTLALEAPTRLVLAAPFPNPAATETQIRYELPRRQRVRLAVYDLLGRRVALLVDAEQEGRHQVTLDAARLGAGLYLYVLEAEDGRRTGRLVVL